MIKKDTAEEVQRQQMEIKNIGMFYVELLKKNPSLESSPPTS